MLSESRRKTIKEEIKIEGIGLHSGKKVTLNLIPANVYTGLVFRTHHRENREIKVAVENVVDTSNAVTLGDSYTTIQTIEHLLAALYTKGITDLIMEIDSIEIPILDGSSKPFIDAINSVGVHEFEDTIEPISFPNPIWVVDGDKYLVILPANELKVTYHIDYNHPLLKGQSITTSITSELLEHEILPARTFGFLRDVEHLKSRGLALGGSLDNAIVLTEDSYLNDSLRFSNECIRHKVLDLVGDLSIVGRPIIGHILCSKGGHALDISMAKLIMSRITGDEITKFKSKRKYFYQKNRFTAMSAIQSAMA